MISVADIAWVRYAAPDLDLMEAFLTDLVCTASSAQRPNYICAAAARSRSCTSLKRARDIQSASQCVLAHSTILRSSRDNRVSR